MIEALQQPTQGWPCQLTNPINKPGTQSAPVAVPQRVTTSVMPSIQCRPHGVIGRDVAEGASVKSLVPILMALEILIERGRKEGSFVIHQYLEANPNNFVLSVVFQGRLFIAWVQ